MANLKISQLTALGGAPADTDLVEVVDVSDNTFDPAGTNKKVTVSEFRSSIVSGTPNRMTKFVTATSIGDSEYTDDGNAFSPTVSGNNLGSSSFNFGDIYMNGTLRHSGDLEIALAGSVRHYFEQNGRYGVGESTPIAKVDITSESQANTGSAFAIKQQGTSHRWFDLSDDKRLILVDQNADTNVVSATAQFQSLTLGKTALLVDVEFNPASDIRAFGIGNAFAGTNFQVIKRAGANVDLITSLNKVQLSSGGAVALGNGIVIEQTVWGQKFESGNGTATASPHWLFTTGQTGNGGMTGIRHNSDQSFNVDNPANRAYGEYKIISSSASGTNQGTVIGEFIEKGASFGANVGFVSIHCPDGKVGIGTAAGSEVGASNQLEVNGNTDSTTYSVNGTAGANFSGAVTNITVVDGIVTAVS